MNVPSVTITCRDTRGIEVGSTISITTLDYRRWNRLWHFITFRERPTITTVSTVVETNSNTLTINDGTVEA